MRIQKQPDPSYRVTMPWSCHGALYCEAAKPFLKKKWHTLADSLLLSAQSDVARSPAQAEALAEVAVLFFLATYAMTAADTTSMDINHLCLLHTPEPDPFLAHK